MYTTVSWYSAAQCSRFTVRPHPVGIRGTSRCVFVCTAVWAFGGAGWSECESMAAVNSDQDSDHIEECHGQVVIAEPELRSAARLSAPHRNARPRLFGFSRDQGQSVKNPLFCILIDWKEIVSDSGRQPTLPVRHWSVWILMWSEMKETSSVNHLNSIAWNNS